MESVVLISILQRQLNLLNLSLFLVTHGAVKFEGVLLEQCTAMSDAKQRAALMIALGAGQSATTILKCSDWRGIPVRDLYSIARSSLESFINAAYLLAEDDAVSERVIRWTKFREWKHYNRAYGDGDLTVTLSSSGNGEILIPPEFEEFCGGRRNERRYEWTALPVEKRYIRLKELGHGRAATRFLAAYMNCYQVASEVIHGSRWGMHYFNNAHMPVSTETSVEQYRVGTDKQYDDLLCDLIHACSGYLHTFFRLYEYEMPFRREQELFNELLVLAGIEPQSINSTRG